MKTKCETCKFRKDFSQAAIERCRTSEQTTDEHRGMLILLTCSGYQAAPQPATVDETRQPASINC